MEKEQRCRHIYPLIITFPYKLQFIEVLPDIVPHIVFGRSIYSPKYIDFHLQCLGDNTVYIWKSVKTH